MKNFRFLKPGDTIGITAPSFGATIEPYRTRFFEAVRLLEERGYKIIKGETCFLSDGIGISSKPERCAKELEDFYCSPAVDAIISCGGGEMMCRTVSEIDFEKIKNAPPKLFMGYSDNTNFIHPLVTKCHVPAVYGPCISGLGKPWEEAELQTINLIEGKCLKVSGFDMFQNPDDGTEAKEENPLSPYILTQKKELKSFYRGSFALPETELKAEGVLLGGCLDILMTIAGTKLEQTNDFIKLMQNENKKIIWVLEACDLGIMDIQRSLWKLDKCGWFKNTSIFLFGRPLNAFNAEAFGLNRFTAVTEMLKKYDVPVVMDCDIGHIAPMMPLIMGSNALVKVKENDISIEMKML